MGRILKLLTLAGAVGGAVWYARTQTQKPQPVTGTWEGTRSLRAQPAQPPAPVPMEDPGPALTAIKGIGEKRAAELKAIGISTVRQLAEADADELSAKMEGRDVSDWIMQAQQLLS